MILYLLLDCRRGVVLSSDVSNELLKEWKKAILDLGVLIDGWPYSISAALVHEEGENCNYYVHESLCSSH